MTKHVSKWFSLGVVNLTVLCSFGANAGSEGHGGEAILCPGHKPILYDVYEGANRNLNFNLGAKSLTAMEKVELALSRFAKLDFYRANYYEKMANSFFADSDIGDFELSTLEDSKKIIRPEGCEVVQLVIQKEPQFPEDKRYFIRKKIWTAMDADQQAAVILHELIYGLAMKLGHVDSVGTRYINEYMMSDKFVSLSNPEYINALKEAHFIRDNFRLLVGIDGKFIFEVGDGFPLEFTEHGYPSGVLAEPTQVNLKNTSLLVQDFVSYYDSGTLKSFTPSEKEQELYVKNQLVKFKAEQIEVYESGAIKSGELFGRTQFNIQGQSVTVGGEAAFFHENTVTFYANGQLKQGKVFGVYKLKDTHGKPVTIGKAVWGCQSEKDWNSCSEAESLVTFDENGLIVDFRPQ